MSDIYFFNPTGEMAIANGNNNYMPPKLLRVFEQDLAFITSFFAKEDDVIICTEKPDKYFIEQWQSLSLPHLKFLSLAETTQIDKIDYLRPWIWSPASHRHLTVFKNRCNTSFKNSPNYKWNDKHKLFFSRTSCNNIQAYIYEHIQHPDIKIIEAAICLNDIDEIIEWINIHNNAVIKTPWSSSGRGVYIVDLSNNKPLNIEWIKGAIKQQGFITIEPLLNKVKDFSYQLKIDSKGDIQFLGISHSTNDDKGHFIGGELNWPLVKNEQSEFLSPSLIKTSSELLIEAVKHINPHNNYEGYFGIDGIVYKDDDNNLKIHPCLDINWRYNMGKVNIRLSEFLNSKSKGIWNIENFSKGQWNTFIKNENDKNPLITEEHKIISGFIPLTPPSNNAQFGAWMKVYRDIE